MVRLFFNKIRGMKLSVITINYNGSENTKKLLISLAGQTDLDFQTIVIDNASGEMDFDSLKEYINHGYDKVLLIKNEQNMGFSGGNNIGIPQALKNGSEWVLLLNNDTWVESDFIASLRLILASKKGILGLPMDEGSRISYCGKIRWLRPTLGHVYSITNKVLRDSILNTEYELRNRSFYVIGGGMLIHKDVFQKIGLLDEKYFLYFEDVDYSVRAQAQGIPVEILAEPMVRHDASSTTKKLGKALLLRYHYRNALYFNFKNGPWYVQLLVWPWSWLVILKQLFKIGAGISEDESRAILAGVFDFYKNRMGIIK